MAGFDSWVTCFITPNDLSIGHLLGQMGSFPNEVVNLGHSGDIHQENQIDNQGFELVTKEADIGTAISRTPQTVTHPNRGLFRL
jgi:hypothetical protein